MGAGEVAVCSLPTAGKRDGKTGIVLRGGTCPRCGSAGSGLAGGAVPALTTVHKEGTMRRHYRENSHEKNGYSVTPVSRWSRCGDERRTLSGKRLSTASAGKVNRKIPDTREGVDRRQSLLERVSKYIYTEHRSFPF